MHITLSLEQERRIAGQQRCHADKLVRFGEESCPVSGREHLGDGDSVSQLHHRQTARLKNALRWPPDVSREHPFCSIKPESRSFLMSNPYVDADTQSIPVSKRFFVFPQLNCTFNHYDGYKTKKRLTAIISQKFGSQSCSAFVVFNFSLFYGPYRDQSEEESHLRPLWLIFCACFAADKPNLNPPRHLLAFLVDKISRNKPQTYDVV